MATVEDIKRERDLHDEWLKEHDKLKNIVIELERKDTVIGHRAERITFGYQREYLTEGLPKPLKTKFLEIAKEELKAFEEFGFDRWLVKRGKV